MKVRLASPYVLIVLCLAPEAGRALADGPAAAAPIRLAVSEHTVADVNPNDANAAVRVWAGYIVRDSKLEFGQEGAMLASSDRLISMIRKGQVDAFAMTPREYVQVASQVDPSVLIVDEDFAKHGLQYVLLVHAESGIKTVADLRGRALIEWKDFRTGLSAEWLGTLLASHGLGPADRFFSRIGASPKISRGVVLPVYFRQADACLVTRRGFETLCELNPELASRLRVVATSPSLLALFLAFHRDCPAVHKEKLHAAFLGLHLSTPGQQALLLFKSQRLVDVDISTLRNSIDLISAYDRIEGRTPQGRRH